MKVSNKMTSNSKTNSLDNAVVDGVIRVIDRSNVQAWTGTMTELNSALVKVLGKKQSLVLPGSPGALRVVVNRVANRLRSRGVSVRFARTTDRNRTRYVRFAY